jgi:hypothetical protein
VFLNSRPFMRDGFRRGSELGIQLSLQSRNNQASPAGTHAALSQTRHQVKVQ